MKISVALFFLALYFLFGIFAGDTSRASNSSTCTIFLDDIATMGIAIEESYLSFAMHQMELLNRLSDSSGEASRMLELDLIDIEMQRVFLTNYCQQNPDGEFIDAIKLLYMEFPEAK